jgi:hypothetical protein
VGGLPEARAARLEIIEFLKAFWAGTAVGPGPLGEWIVEARDLAGHRALVFRNLKPLMMREGPENAIKDPVLRIVPTD